MRDRVAVKALSSLAHEHRLKVFKILVRYGPEGITAGNIAKQLRLPPSSLSFHLSHLEASGLVRSWRRQRWIFYAIEVRKTQQLLRFLTEDCCRDLPELYDGLKEMETACA